MNRITLACMAYIAMMITSCNESTGNTNTKTITRFDSINNRLTNYSLLSRQFIKQQHYESNFCFLVDMHRPSGDNRFLIYNLAKDSIESAAKVAHGRCNEEWLEGRKYSNKPGSGCSSLGKYRVGIKYKGMYGIAFKLHGLDSANSNAYKRNIVLHAHKCVPGENDPSPEICQSDGCVMVSPSFLQILEGKLKSASQPVLLWLYDE